MTRQTVTNDFDTADLGPLSELPTIEAAEFADWTPEGQLPDRNPPAQANSRSAAKRDPATLRLLQAIVDHPGMPSSKYPKLARMSPRKATEVRKQLVEQGLVLETELQTKARGRTAIVLTPAEGAMDALDADQTPGEPTV